MGIGQSPATYREKISASFVKIGKKGLPVVGMWQQGGGIFMKSDYGASVDIAVLGIVYIAWRNGRSRLG